MAYEAHDVSMWLKLLAKFPKPLVPLYTLEFKKLSKLAPIQVVRVIKTPNGEPRVYMIDRVETINLLKELYHFHTKAEASQIVTEETG